MILPIAAVIAVLGILFGGPALVPPVRRAYARRAAAWARRDAAEEQARQDAATRQQALIALWTDDPETAGVGEALTYQASVRAGLVQQAEEEHRRLGQREGQVQHRKAHVRDGGPVTP